MIIDGYCYVGLIDLKSTAVSPLEEGTRDSQVDIYSQSMEECCLGNYLNKLVFSILQWMLNS